MCGGGSRWVCVPTCDCLGQLSTLKAEKLSKLRGKKTTTKNPQRASASSVK